MYIKDNQLRMFGVRIRLHWSVLLIAVACAVVALDEPSSALSAISAMCSYFAILVIHELGHAFVARYFGYDVYEIRIAVFIGQCVYEAPRNELHDAVIAWGGVAAQLLVATIVMLLALIPGIDEVPGLGPVIAFLGYLNVIFALFNLAPTPPLDGAKAWRVFPLLLQKRKRDKRMSKFRRW